MTNRYLTSLLTTRSYASFTFWIGIHSISLLMLCLLQKSSISYVSLIPPMTDPAMLRRALGQMRYLLDRIWTVLCYPWLFLTIFFDGIAHFKKCHRKVIYGWCYLCTMFSKYITHKLNGLLYYFRIYRCLNINLANALAILNIASNERLPANSGFCDIRFFQKSLSPIVSA